MPILRELEIDDYHRGFLDLLSQLTVVGDISFDQFKETFMKMKDSNTFVIEDCQTNKIIASGSLLIEQKFVHNCRRVGHIEDIVTDQNYRGQGLGKWIIEHLMKLAQGNGCYKVILDCAKENISFYEKCGFEQKEFEMARYFE